MSESTLEQKLRRWKSLEIYETQHGKRRCGTATLVMIYRSFGLSVDQETVWKELQSYSAGKARTRTFHLARNALEHGLSAVVVRIRNPKSFLLSGFFQSQEVRMIPVCRIRRDSGLGHFSLFLETDGVTQTVSLHDPLFGPNRSVDLADFLELWVPCGADDEITKNIAVLIAESRNTVTACSACSRTFYLDPLRCSECTLQIFETMFCPFCDEKVKTFSWNYS